MKCPRKHLVKSHKTKHLRKSLLYPFTVTCAGHQNLLLIINSILFQLRHYLLVVPLVRLVQPWPSKLVNKILGHYLPKRYARDTPEAEVPQSASKGPEAAMVLASVLFSLPAASKSGTEIHVHCYPGTPKKLYVINSRGYYLKITSRCGYKRAEEQNRLLTGTEKCTSKTISINNSAISTLAWPLTGYNGGCIPNFWLSLTCVPCVQFYYIS